MAVSDGAILRVVASMLFPDSVIAQNVFYAVFADTGGSDDEDDVVSDLVDWCEAMFGEITGMIVNDVTTSEIQVYEYDAGDDDWDEVGSASWSVTFTDTADMMPHGVAAVLHNKTSDPDTWATKYIGGLGETQALDSDIIAGALADLADFVTDWNTSFIGAATGGTFGPGVWSEKDTVFKLFNGTGSVNGILGYQRRRKPGVGI
jgi:hypothetical protein